MLARRSLLATALAGATGAARADESWPTRPVRLLVTFGAGGGADRLARTLAPHFPAIGRGQALVIDNRPGAGGTLAAAHVATAPPDGHTLLLANFGANAVAGALFRSLPYDPVASFAPIIHLVNIPLVLVGHPGLPFGDIPGLIRHARAQPGSLHYASAGPGGAAHLAPELLNRMAGINVVHVAYRSGSQQTLAVAQREVDMTTTSIASALPLIRDGRAKPLGVCAPSESRLLPGLAPIAATVPGYAAGTWHGIVAPVGTPAPIIATANSTFAAMLARPEIRRLLVEAEGNEIVGGTSDAFGSFLRSEAAKWNALVRDLGVSPE